MGSAIPCLWSRSLSGGIAMRGLSIEGYAIVSAAGMIADRNGHMPDGLKCAVDAQLFTEALDDAALVAHGRHSHERQGTASDRRRRMIVSDCSAVFFVHPTIPNAWVWNPASVAFEEACGRLGVTEGTIAVSGGTGVFGLFLKIGFDAFYLSHAAKLLCCRVAGRSFRKCRPKHPNRCFRSMASGLHRYKYSTANLM